MLHAYMLTCLHRHIQTAYTQPPWGSRRATSTRDCKSAHCVCVSPVSVSLCLCNYVVGHMELLEEMEKGLRCV
jgi:hypothetical protein